MGIHNSKVLRRAPLKLIWAGGNQKGLCHGDSGGPIINFDSNVDAKYFIQIGVIHGGILECSNDVYPAIFVRLDHPDILDFVKNAIYPTSTSKTYGSKSTVMIIMIKAGV